MLGEIVSVFHEILTTIIEEIQAAPMQLVAEVVQFVILIAIVWVVAVGFGKRRGFVVNMLSEKHDALTAHVSEALGSDEELSTARHDAAASERAARAEARRVVAEATHDAAKIRDDARNAADTDADLVTSRARTALATEREEMEIELRERLIETVAAATRAIMNEQMTVSEQRTLIEDSISASVGPDGGKKPIRLRAEKVRA